jgi:hypothetical protein
MKRNGHDIYCGLSFVEQNNYERQTKRKEKRKGKGERGKEGERKKRKTREG